MASGSASTAGRATEPARGIRTLEKSGVPPGRTAGSGTCSFSGPYPVIWLPSSHSSCLVRSPGRATRPRARRDSLSGMKATPMCRIDVRPSGTRRMIAVYRRKMRTVARIHIAVQIGTFERMAHQTSSIFARLLGPKVTIRWSGCAMSRFRSIGSPVAFAVAVCAIVKLRKCPFRLPQQHLDPFAVLDHEFSFRVRTGMVGLVSLLGDIVELPMAGSQSSSCRRSARNCSNRRRKYSTCFGFMNSSSSEG